MNWQHWLLNSHALGYMIGKVIAVVIVVVIGWRAGRLRRRKDRDRIKGGRY